MSAQQREALSRGQMSTTTGSPARISPKPDSCPLADCAPWETIASSGSSQPCSSHTACIAARTSSEVSPGRSSWISERATPMAASAAFCARRMPASSNSFLTRRRRWNSSSSIVSSIPFARRWSATNSGNSGGTVASVMRSACTARRQISASRCTWSRPEAIRSSWPSVAGSMISIPWAETWAASSTETVAARRPSFSRYRNGSPIPAGISWKSVAELLRRSVDQDGDAITSRRASTVGTWRT